MNPITLVLSAAFVLAAFAIGAWGHTTTRSANVMLRLRWEKRRIIITARAQFEG
ncbi:hypothetical protein GE569_14290 [Burkholderia gladioli]